MVGQPHRPPLQNRVQTATDEVGAAVMSLTEIRTGARRTSAELGGAGSLSRKVNATLDNIISTYLYII